MNSSELEEGGGGGGGGVWRFRERKRQGWWRRRRKALSFAIQLHSLGPACAFTARACVCARSHACVCVSFNVNLLRLPNI